MSFFEHLDQDMRLDEISRRKWVSNDMGVVRWGDRVVGILEIRGEIMHSIKDTGERY